ncbi:heterokaryon incompatibility protein Het-C-domain-containing protein, partial [Halenospora varia]
RHGDIEDTLLTLVMSRAAGGKKFDKMNVARVYFGNWLRDYSQAIDVGTVKSVSAEAIRILLWVLGFMTFGYGTKEFEVTAERLGCYRPEDHIDNPKDYADNIDATQYDPRLRGPVDERVELAIDPRTGMKNYIANEQAGIMTSALHVRKLFGKCIQLGRSYNRSQNKDELYEALRLLGTGLHCLEDFSAHSNYTELALIEMGERDVFPHVGRRTQIRLQGARGDVYPLITGTFGGVDFLHSVMGEFDDKATQSEIESLEGSLQSSGNADTSVLKDLLNSVPSGLFGGKDEAGKADELQANAAAAQMNQMRVSPRQPEEFTRQMQEVARQIYPTIQWHDEVMQSIREAIEKIPVLPDLIEQIENQITVFVFSLIAPFILPVINQIKTELNTGSSEIIQSSKDKQLIVFHDDNSSDPTHSMLSKDHFSNILNEPAGKIASSVLKWAVPQIIACWDDERSDPERTINRIINGVFHHPAQRNMGDDGASDGRQQMFGVVSSWWQGMSQGEQQSYRQKLTRDGVMNGENHKEGVHDSGHGCGKPISMNKQGAGGASGGAAGAILGGLSGSGGGKSNSQIGKFAEEAVGGGPLGGLVGAIAGGVGGSLLGGLMGGDKEEKTYKSEGYTQQGGYQQTTTQISHSGNQYGQAQYSETQYPSGGRKEEFSSYNQSGSGYGQSQGFQQATETRPTYGGGYEQTNERRYERPGGNVETETWSQGRTSEGQSYGSPPKKKYGRQESDDDDDYKKKKQYGRNDDSDSDENKYKKKHHKKKSNDSNDGRPSGYGGQQGGFGEGYNEPPRQEYGGYGGRQEPPQEFGGGPGYGRPPPPDEGFGGGYGRQEPPRQEYGQGGGGYQSGQYGEQNDEQQYGRPNRGYGNDEEDEQQGSYGRRRDENREDQYQSGGYNQGVMVVSNKVVMEVVDGKFLASVM